MKRNSLLVFGVALMLSACGGSATVVKTMHIRVADSAKVMTILQATEKVMERRFAALKLKNARASVVPTSAKTATLTLELPDAEAAEKMEAILSEEFTFDIRIEKEKEGNVKDETLPSEWIPTAFTGSSLSWVQAVGNKNTGRVAIELQFTEQGRTVIQSIFRENVGKNIGIFVRSQLMSTFTITDPNIGDTIAIGGAPSASIAEVFADDVNMGLLVNFTNP